MSRSTPNIPEPALQALLDEVVVPLLVERFLRAHEASAEAREQDGGSVSSSRVIETVRVESSPG